MSQKSIGNVKDFKAGPFEKGKIMIETVHARLKSKRHLQGDLVNLQQIDEHLSLKLRQQFNQLPIHS